MSHMNPFEQLPNEILTHVLSYLDPEPLAAVSSVSSNWQESSSIVWDEKCHSLWAEKLYIPSRFKKLKESGFSKEAFISSKKDLERQYITLAELCDFQWNFRFKEAAGDHWVDHDPWWRGASPNLCVFYPNGTCKVLDDQGNERMPRMEMKWRFVRSAGGRVGPEGSFIQVNNYPPYIVSRYKGGFIMQSCWVVYTSFSLPPMGTCVELEDRNLDVTTDVMSTEAMQYNIGIEFNINDQGQIVNLLHLLAQIQNPDGGDLVDIYNTVFGEMAPAVNVGEDDYDDDDDEDEDDEDEDEDEDNEGRTDDNDVDMVSDSEGGDMSFTDSNCEV